MPSSATARLRHGPRFVREVERLLERRGLDDHLAQVRLPQQHDEVVGLHLVVAARDERVEQLGGFAARIDACTRIADAVA
jgi:hypothetical protein